MIRVVRQLGYVVIVFLLGCTNIQASVSVSPVIIEAVQVQAGQSFEILCQNFGEQEIEVQLSLALFDQDENGSVVFLEDAEAVHRVTDLLRLETRSLSLDPQGQGLIQVELTRDDFDNLYAVLFVQPRQTGFQTRFAVLFLLSTSGDQVDIEVSSFVRQEDALNFTVQNNGLRHGPWEGELHLFDASNQLSEKRQITSGVVLAGRRRPVQVSLPSWVQRVEVVSDQSGQAR